MLQGQKQDFSEFGTILSLTPLLIEQNFGSLEGKSWANQIPKNALRRNWEGASVLDNTKTNTPKESKQSLRYRADSFLDLHLLPTLRTASNSGSSVIMVMSHGIILRYIVRQFALRLPEKTLFMGTCEEENIIDPKSLDDLCQWSNTGYVELRFEKLIGISCEYHHAFGYDSGEETSYGEADLTSSSPRSLTVGGRENKLIGQCDGRTCAEVKPNNSSMRHKYTSGNIIFPNSWVTLVETVNGAKHLQSLKRTGGGIGSAKFDKRQKTLKSFLK